MADLYFSHDVDAMSDPKIESLILERGMAGYGSYWAIVEMLRRAEDDGYRLRVGNVTVRAIAARCRITKGEADDLLAELIEEHELFVTDGEWIYSESLLRRMAIKDAKKDERAESGRKGAEKRWNKAEPRNRKAQPSQNDTQPDAEDGSAIATDSSAIDSHRLPSAKNSKGKGKDKYKHPSGVASADASPPMEVAGRPPGLFRAVQASYESRWDDGELPSYKDQVRHIGSIVDRAAKSRPDDPESWARDFIHAHWRLKNDPQSLLFGQPFLPSIAMSKGLLPRVLDAMQQQSARASPAGLDLDALTEGQRRRLQEVGAI